MTGLNKEKLMRDFQQYLSKIEEVFLTSTEELTTTEQQFRAIVEQAADAIVIVNNKLKILSWNEGAEYVFGYKAYEALGLSIDELITRDDVLKQSQALSNEIYDGKKIRSVEAIRYAKGGVPKNVIISGTPVRSSDGQIRTICLIYKDITELKKAQDNLIQSEKQATLGIIAGSIGHELNNLVGGLTIYAHMLKESYDDTKQVKEIADIFCEQLTSISFHAKNLLSLGKPIQPQIMDVDVIFLLKETTRTLKVSGILKYFKVIENFDSTIPWVKGDPHLLEQVIRNLEINSAHALEKRGTITIGARLSENFQYVEFYVQDDGPGIQEEIREKIFEKFFTTKKDGKGTGLGLPIVKQIVEQHSGYLKLATKVGEGTCITVGIPIAKSSVPIENL